MNFKNTQYEIKIRNVKIEALRRELREYVIWVGGSGVIIDENRLEEAAKISEEILALKETNETMHALIKKYTEIIKKCDLTGKYFPDPNLCDLDEAIKNAEKDLEYLDEGTEEYLKQIEILDKFDEANAEIEILFSMFRKDFEIAMMIKYGNLGWGNGYGLIENNDTIMSNRFD